MAEELTKPGGNPLIKKLTGLIVEKEIDVDKFLTELTDY